MPSSNHEIDPPDNGANESALSPVIAASKRIPKRRRNARACDRCHRNACKCSPGIEGRTCSRCKNQGVACTYSRPAKRRGPPPRRSLNGDNDMISPPSPRKPQRSESSAAAHAGLPATSRDTEPDNECIRVSTPRLSTSNFYPAYEDEIRHETIEALLKVFFHASYPLRPYFHWPSYVAQVMHRQYQTDWGVFIVTMAVCSLGAIRLCDGAPMGSDPHPLRSEAVDLFSKCFAAAVKAMPSESISCPDYYPLMKAKSILASACIQNGDLKRAYALLGDYNSLCVTSGFHVEANWPTSLTQIQREERRRFFWGVYQQEQYLANNAGFVSRQRDAKVTVQYPVEVYDDEDITETGIRLRTEQISFLRGFNYCTDLYRILEHMDGGVRGRQQVSSEELGGAVASFLYRLRPSKEMATECLQLITRLHEDLPEDLKSVKVMTGDPQVDRNGYIAYNILITTQTLKLLLVGTERPSVHMRCAIASELLDELSAIPMEFFHASSTVSLHHMAQVGHILGSVTHYPLSTWAYVQVRNILLVLADFLHNIESTRSSAPGLATKLRAQITRIDQHMQRSDQQAGRTGLISMGQALFSGWPKVGSDVQPPMSPGQRASDKDTSNQPAPAPRNVHSLTNDLSLDDTDQISSRLSYQQQQQRVLPSSQADPGEAFSSSAETSVLSSLFGEPQQSTFFPASASMSLDVFGEPEHLVSLPGGFFSDWPYLTGQMNDFAD